jgi:hypothetical protein
MKTFSSPPDRFGFSICNDPMEDDCKETALNVVAL